MISASIHVLCVEYLPFAQGITKALITMKTYKLLQLFISVLLSLQIVFFSNQVFAAEMVYVSDELEITLRSGPGLKNKITKMLKSGDALDILKRNNDGYVQVKTQEGTRGWVLTRFLMDDPSARARLEEVMKRETNLASQQKEIENLKKTAISSNLATNSLQKINKNLKAELAKIKKIAAETLVIHEKNEEIAAALVNAETKQTELQVDNERLKRNTEQAWFLRGAGVILLGMLLGLLIPKLRFKRKRKWGELSS